MCKKEGGGKPTLLLPKIFVECKIRLAPEVDSFVQKLIGVGS